MTYTPQPGTVAARVVAWLQARPSGEYNASQIAEALNVDPKAIAPSLEVALREKLVFHRQRDRTSPRAPWWYSATDREAHARRNGFAAAATWMQAPKKDSTAGPPASDGAASEGTAVTPGPSQPEAAPDTPQGDQPRSERGREVMEPAGCESADGRGTTGAPALATLPQHASPGVGPMGAGQPADAGPTTDKRSGGQGTRPCADEQSEGHGRHAPVAAPGWRESSPLHHDEQRREVDAQFAASLRAAMGQGDQLQPADLAATRRAAHAPHEPAPLAFRAARFSDGSLATERDGVVVAVYSAAEVDAIQKLLGVRG